MTRAMWMLAAGALTLAGCRGEELTRVQLAKAGDSGQATWKTDGAVTAQVWSDYEGDWTGGDKPGLDYGIELLDGATVIQTQSCQTGTCGTSVCRSTTRINDKHSGACECKMSCALAAPKAGTYTVKATVNDPGGHFTAPKNLSLVLRK